MLLLGRLGKSVSPVVPCSYYPMMTMILVMTINAGVERSAAAAAAAAAAWSYSSPSAAARQRRWWSHRPVPPSNCYPRPSRRGRAASPSVATATGRKPHRVLPAAPRPLSSYSSCLCLSSSSSSSQAWSREWSSSSAPPPTSSPSSPLFAELAEAKRLAREALDAYRRNAASAAVATAAILREQVRDLETEQAQPGFWDDGAAARKRASAVNNLLSSKRRLLARLEKWAGWEGDLLAALEMLQQQQPTDSTGTCADSGAADATVPNDDATAMLLRELRETGRALLDDSIRYELELLLSGPYDASPARVVLTAGAGGTEANDWVSDLCRMYRRHCEAMGFDVQLEDAQPGDVVGYKSVEMIVTGDNAYGWLQGEKGAHRLVRLSPFNASNKRQTTFAGVDVSPLLDESVADDFDVPESQLEITAMRAGGKGGQNVNKVNSAVRVRHVPTGLQVKCSQERSQVQNKQIALRRLKSQLLAIAQEQRVQEIAQIRGDQVEASWGAQIRSYVLHPYRLVKDQRTGWETTSVQAVLDGDLKDCIGAYLRHKAEEDAKSSSSSSSSSSDE